MHAVSVRTLPPCADAKRFSAAALLASSLVRLLGSTMCTRSRASSLWAAAACMLRARAAAAVKRTYPKAYLAFKTILDTGKMASCYGRCCTHC